MKIRTGFVGNSSSSSFCILGKIYNEKKLENMINSTVGYFIHNNKLDLSYEYGVEEYDADDIIIGVPVDELQEDISILENKQKIVDRLSFFDKQANINDIYFYVDGGYTG